MGEIIKTTFKPKQTGQKTNSRICPTFQAPSILKILSPLPT